MKNGVNGHSESATAAINETASPARRWQKYAQITGWGMYVPHQGVPNANWNADMPHE